MEEETSPILKEIPVYISQTLAENLVLYQYSLEERGLNTHNAEVIQCSIKQSPHEVKFELERNIESANYCMAKGEQIAINVDGRDAANKKPDEVVFPRNIMDRQTFISKPLSDQNCVVGILQDNELHLTPLGSVAVLRPSFKYLDKSDKRAKNDTKEGEGDNSGEEEEETKQVTVKFARQEDEKMKKARECSFGYVNKMNAKEIWYRANYYDKTSDRSEMELNKLYCNKMNEKANDVKMNNYELLALISKDDEDSTNSSHGDSLSAVKKLPLVEKVRRLLIDARLIQFSQLTKYLGCVSNSEIQDYLKAVQQVAVLVQGCWVIQSDIIYSKEILTGGVPGLLMRSARDYILYLFTKGRTVLRRKILETVKLPQDLVKEILEEVSTLRQASREWEFMLPTDNEFIKSYPEVVQRQYIKWEMKQEQLMEGFKNTESNFSSSPPVNRHRRKSYRDSSFSSDNESGAESRRNGYPMSGHKIRRTKKISVSFSEVNANANIET